jgi:DNA-binding SARP family transcriptional activator
MTALRIAICGRLTIEHPAATILEAAFPARQGRRLWAFLVLNRRIPVSRDRIAGAVWGDDIPEAWDTTLNGVISRLRALLRPIAAAEPGISLRGEVGRYQLCLPNGVFVDAERARFAMHSAETRLRGADIGGALSEARVAIEIAARGFLDGEHGPWIEGQRRALRDIQIHALECTAEAELRRGNAHLAEHEAEHLIALDPLRESGYRVLMRALAAGGNRAAVARVMEECRCVLEREAGVGPSRETLALRDDLMMR